MEVTGYAAAARWVYGQALERDEAPPAPLLTLTEIRHIHRLCMGPDWEVAPHPHATDQEGPGSFRQHDIARFSGGMIPPSHVLVAARLQDWLDEARRFHERGEPHMMERLARLHVHFEQVHPFLDGNGRVGRLLLNLLLTRLGYPPAVIQKRDRERYLRALRFGDAGNFGALGEMIARAVLDNLYRFVVPVVAGPVRLVPLAAVGTGTASVVALRSAAERGRLQAQRGNDGQWRSNRAWVDEYLSSRHRGTTASSRRSAQT